MFDEPRPRTLAPQGARARASANPAATAADIVLRLAGRQLVDSRGKALHLTGLEVRLIWYLSSQAGREVCSKELLQHVWRYAPTVESHTVQTHVWRLRRKLAAMFPRTELISTGRIGYALADGVQICGAHEIN